MKENKQFRNENKRKIWLYIGSAVAVLLICVVLVGLINGQWPWQNNGAGNYTGLPTVGTSEEETIGTDNPTFNTENIDVTIDVDIPDNDNNSGNSGNSGNSCNSGNSGNSGGNGTGTGNSGGNSNTDIDFDSLLGAAGNSNSGSNTGSNNSGNSSTQTTTPETTAPETTVPETTSLIDIDIPID